MVHVICGAGQVGNLSPCILWLLFGFVCNAEIHPLRLPVDCLLPLPTYALSSDFIIFFFQNTGIIKVWISKQFPEFLNIINEVKKVFLNGTH